MKRLTVLLVALMFFAVSFATATPAQARRTGHDASNDAAQKAAGKKPDKPGAKNVYRPAASDNVLPATKEGERK